MPLPSSCFKVRQDFIILIFLILSWQLCPAQSRDIRFNRLTTDQGLLSSSALLAVQDYQGFMWFGSEEGLQRYDGYSFKTYLANEHDTTSLSSSYIQEILEDSHHNLWIGTLDGGLCWYDPALDRFIRFQHDAANQKSLISNFVQVLYEDAHETLYI
ncbi:MAG: ligand-binding sensor domain-containing protein, partial [Bacteroidota bacterium]